MTSRDFAYWLQGFFEINGKGIKGTLELNPDQVQIIRNHLNLVFHHEIDKQYKEGDGSVEVHNGSEFKDDPIPDFKYTPKPPDQPFKPKFPWENIRDSDNGLLRC